MQWRRTGIPGFMPKPSGGRVRRDPAPRALILPACRKHCSTLTRQQAEPAGADPAQAGRGDPPRDPEAGQRLAVLGKLAGQLGVARNTVVLACQQLVAEGVLTVVRAAGLYVAQRVARPVYGSGSLGERGSITGRWQQWLKARANPDTARVARPMRGNIRSAFSTASSTPRCFRWPSGVRLVAMRWAAATGRRGLPAAVAATIRCSSRNCAARSCRGVASMRAPRKSSSRWGAAGPLPGGGVARRFQRVGRDRGAGLPGDASPDESPRGPSYHSRSTTRAC